MGYGKEAGKVYKTKDYNIFKLMNGNRDFDAHGKKLVRSVERWGIIMPIIVNENMEIVDGQGRLYAAKETGVEVPYIIKPKLNIKTCLEINTQQKGWTYKDYIKSFADQGNNDYKTLLAAAKTYTHIPMRVVWFAISGGMTTEQNTIIRGSFKVFPKQGLTIEDSLTFIDNIAANPNIYRHIPGRKYIFFNSILYALGSGEATKKRLLGCLEAYIQNQSVFLPFNNAEAGIRSLEKAYNYNKKTNEKINLLGFYLNVKRNNLTWFGAPKGEG